MWSTGLASMGIQTRRPSFYDEWVERLTGAMGEYCSSTFWLTEWEPGQERHFDEFFTDLRMETRQARGTERVPDPEQLLPALRRRLKTVLLLTPTLLATSDALPLNGSGSTHKGRHVERFMALLAGSCCPEESYVCPRKERG